MTSLGLITTSDYQAARLERFGRPDEAASSRRTNDVAVLPSQPNRLILPFVGHCLVTVRPHGKVRLPLFVRRVLDLKPSRIFIGLHEHDACLTGFDARWQHRLSAEIDDRRLDTCGRARDTVLQLARRTFATSDEIGWPFDNIRLPPLARRLAGIDDAALFVGAGATFEIWNPQAAAASSDPSLRAMAEDAGVTA